jgi:hypothetical protein
MFEFGIKRSEVAVEHTWSTCRSMGCDTASEARQDVAVWKEAAQQPIGK